MELILGAMVCSAMLMVGPRMISSALIDLKAASAGEWAFVSTNRERRAAARARWLDLYEQRRQHLAAKTGTGQVKPGPWAYGMDVYRGWWEDALVRRRAKRAARPEYVYDPDRPAWHERVDQAVLGKVNRLRSTVGAVKAEFVKAPAPFAAAEQSPATDENTTGDTRPPPVSDFSAGDRHCPECGGLMVNRAGRWTHANTSPTRNLEADDAPSVAPPQEDPRFARLRAAFPSDPTAAGYQSDEQLRQAIAKQDASDEADRDRIAGLTPEQLKQREQEVRDLLASPPAEPEQEPRPAYDIDGEVVEAQTDQPALPTTQNGATMTAEMTQAQAIAEHDELLRKLQDQLDQFIAVRTSLNAAASGIDGADAGRHAVSTQASTTAEALAEMTKHEASLEGTISTAEVMSASQVSGVQEHVEAALAENQQWIDRTEEQMASVRESMQAITATFSDAADVLASTGTKGGFLDQA